MGWYSDYTATTPDSGNVVGIPMVSLRSCLESISNSALALG